MQLKPKIPAPLLERPYIKGILYGMIIGIGICYIIMSAILNLYSSILTGLVIFIFGLFISLIEGGTIWDSEKK